MSKIKQIALGTLINYIRKNTVLTVKTSGGFIHIVLKISKFDVLNRSIPFNQRNKDKAVNVKGEVTIRG